MNTSSTKVEVFFLKKRKCTLGTITGPSPVYFRKKKRTKTYLLSFSFNLFFTGFCIPGYNHPDRTGF